MLTIMKASAGSGKTYKLTYTYILLLLGDVDSRGRRHLNTRQSDRHRPILAITFTNKATDEMKQRIIRELAILADIDRRPDGRHSPYMDDLVRDLSATPDEIRRESRRALTELLFDFNSFNVSTIDRFFQQILRSFAFEAEIEGDYELDLDTKAAVIRAIDTLFTEFNHGALDTDEYNRLRRWFGDYLTRQSENGRSVMLFNRMANDFNNFADAITRLGNDTFKQYSRQLLDFMKGHDFENFMKAVSSKISMSQRNVASLATDAVRAMDACPADYNMTFRKSILGWTGQYRPDAATGNIQKFADGSLNLIKGFKGHFDRNEAESLGLAPVYDACMDFCVAALETRKMMPVLTAIQRQSFYMGLMSAIYERMSRERLDKNLLLLEDTPSLLKAIIGDNPDTSFIFERMGVRLRHYLIDEFQDTSALQWDILSHLVRESQSYSHDNLIIGDVKQSIYRFRGSDPNLLDSVVEKDLSATGEVQVKGILKEENSNWRSAAEIVRFNNRLFTTLADTYGFAGLYNNVDQQVRKEDLSGYVSVCGIEGKKDDFTAAALDRMLDNIHRQLLDGYRGSDIAVLLRSNEEARMVVRFLTDSFAAQRFAGFGLRVISDDAMRVSASAAVSRIVAMLRLLSCWTPGVDDTAGSPRPRYRSRDDKLLMTALYEYNLRSDNPSPGDALSKAVEGRLTPQAADDLRQLASGNDSLPSLIQRISALCWPDGIPAEDAMYILAFEDLVNDYTALNPPDILSFLRWWDSEGLKRCLATAPGSNAVRVMTIHKSKGLEFNCVHLPLLTTASPLENEVQWFDSNNLRHIDNVAKPPRLAIRLSKELSQSDFKAEYEECVRGEMLNKLNTWYVAFTRACRELIVSFQIDLSKKSYSASSNDAIVPGRMMVAGLKGVGIECDTVEHTWGTPTKPHNNSSETVLQSLQMPAITVSTHDSIWNGTRVELEGDDSLGQRRGTVLHDILANMSTRDDLLPAVAMALAAGRLRRWKEGMSDDILTDRYATRIIGDAIDSLTLARRWFGTDVEQLRERSVVTDRGLIRRPDRVVIYPDDSVDVIDYKFGEIHDLRYSRQVSQYMRVMKAMGYDNVRGYIWYVTKGIVHSVTAR